MASDCAQAYTEVLPVGCGNDASRGLDSERGVNSPSPLGRKTNRHLDVIEPFPFGFGKERRSPSNSSIRGEQSKRQWRASRACGTGADQTTVWRFVLRFLGAPKAVQSFPAKSRILGFLRHISVYMTQTDGHLCFDSIPIKGLRLALPEPPCSAAVDGRGPVVPEALE